MQSSEQPAQHGGVVVTHLPLHERVSEHERVTLLGFAGRLACREWGRARIVGAVGVTLSSAGSSVGDDGLGRRGAR